MLIHQASSPLLTLLFHLIRVIDDGDVIYSSYHQMRNKRYFVKLDRGHLRLIHSKSSGLFARMSSRLLPILALLFMTTVEADSVCMKTLILCSESQTIFWFWFWTWYHTCRIIFSSYLFSFLCVCVFHFLKVNWKITYLVANSSIYLRN